MNIYTPFQSSINDSAGLGLAVWMKGPSAGRVSVGGHGGYLAAGQDVLLSRHAGLRWEQMSDIVPEVKKEAETDGGRVM